MPFSLRPRVRPGTRLAQREIHEVQGLRSSKVQGSWGLDSLEFRVSRLGLRVGGGSTALGNFKAGTDVCT